MYSAVYASSRASGAPKTTNKTPRLPSAVSGGNKAPWGLGTPYGAKSAPPREWYPTSVKGSGLGLVNGARVRAVVNPRARPGMFLNHHRRIFERPPGWHLDAGR